VSHDVIFVPNSPEHRTYYRATQSEGFARELASFIVDMYNLGVDVHVAQPDYRQIFKTFLRENQDKEAKKVPAERVHLTEDRAFFYSGHPDSNHEWENIKISLTFQREVINQVIPRAQPDLIHCQGWMTGLIPAMAKELEIPCFFAVGDSHSAKSCLSYIEDMGIDTAAFWQYLFYENFPGSYEQTRDTIPADFLLSGIFSASFIDTPAPERLMDMVGDRKSFFETSLRQLLVQKWKAGQAFTFNQQVAAKQYIDAYARILQRPIIDINPQSHQSSIVNSRIAA
jgi:starch synthase/alpha-amylase